MQPVKQESTGSATTPKTKLRYPLRSSGAKPKDGKSAVVDTASSTSKRGKPVSNVCKSVSVLNISGKDESPKTPRRLSIPAKSTFSPLPRLASTRTPASHNQTKNYNKGQETSEKTVSDVSKSVTRRKFSVLSSTSYWLSQVKISESAAKHSVSLGFFKLALESGCEPLQRMRDELKSYVCRHNLVELREPLKEVLSSYNILEDIEQLQVSETCSLVPDEATPPAVGVNSSSSIDGGKKLKPKSLTSKNIRTSSVTESAKRGSPQKISARKNMGSLNRNPAKPKTSAVDVPASNLQKKSERSTEQVAKDEQAKTQDEGEIYIEKYIDDQVFFVPDPVECLPSGGTEQDDKENKDTQQSEEVNLTEIVT